MDHWNNFFHKFSKTRTEIGAFTELKCHLFIKYASIDIALLLINLFSITPQFRLLKVYL